MNVGVAKQIWDTLHLAHEGVDKVRRAKIDLLMAKLNRFVIIDGEGPQEMFDGLMTLMTLHLAPEDTTTKRGPNLHHSGPTDPCGRPPCPAQSPLALRHLVLLPAIYFIDFKAVLGRFI
jgi:hypothetical protein